jgi:hypothetical protein
VQLEQNDEWQLQHRYMQVEAMTELVTPANRNRGHKEGDIAAAPGAGVSKSAVSRRLVALSAERMRAWRMRQKSPLLPLR